MIRILVRQVVDARHRAPKSLASADIEDPAQLELAAAGFRRPFTIRLYHSPPRDAEVRIVADFNPPPGKPPDVWPLIIAALKAAFPP